jgi:inhibitor of KinA sporulation pathway (predicted exonuclease)
MDLEWNMGSRKEELKMMPFEIIEIGAVRLNDDMVETGRFSRLIKPKVYRNMHRINGSIVHITNNDLKDAESFEEVYSAFSVFCQESVTDDKDYIFCTWGDSDLTELQRNINYFDCIPLTAGPLEYLDVQKLFGYYRGEPKSRVSLETAVETLSIPETKGFHRAVNDAAYTAEILKRIDKGKLKYTSYNTYHTPATVEDEIFRDYDRYVKQISVTFNDKRSLMKNGRQKKLICPKCGNELSRTIPWFTLNGKHYLAAGKCEEHGNIKAKIRIKKDEILEGVYAIKTTKVTDEEGISEMWTKYKKAEYQKSTSSKSE